MNNQKPTKLDLTTEQVIRFQKLGLLSWLKTRIEVLSLVIWVLNFCFEEQCKWKIIISWVLPGEVINSSWVALELLTDIDNAPLPKPVEIMSATERRALFYLI